MNTSRNDDVLRQEQERFRQHLDRQLRRQRIIVTSVIVLTAIVQISAVSVLR